MGRELGDRTAWQRCAHVGPEFDCVDFNQLVNRSCEAIGDLANVALNSYFFLKKKTPAAALRVASCPRARMEAAQLVHGIGTT